MSLILDQSGLDAPRIVGVVCDGCHAEVRNEIDLQEVVHLRLYPGYGPAWGDGNTVDVDLCDACGHRTFAPYARVLPSDRARSTGASSPFREALTMAKKPKRVRAGDSAYPADGSMDAPAAIDVLPLSVVRRNLRGILRHPRPIVVTRSGIALIVMRPIGSSDEAFDVTQRERP